MAIIRGPKIVTKGLVMALDAADGNSYPAIEALIVAGGGSGGVDNGGGGGGGGVILTGLNISVNTAYSIVVGAGGAARLGTSDDGPGNNGANSTAFGYTAIGGGGGTGWVNTTLPPGSATYSGGSGAGQSASTSSGNSRGAGTGTAGQGFNGGTSVAAYAGGGGGAGGPGGNATNGNVGAGGEGLYVGHLFGSSVGVNGYVAGGGAGGFDVFGGYSSTSPFTRNGTVKKLTQTAEDPCPNNTGAGGNGGNHNNNTSGAGGSGVVLIRYLGPQRATGGTVYSFRGYTIHRFDSNGTFTLTSGNTTTWYDLSGNNYNGTLTFGPIYNSANGGSIVFDGQNDYVSIPSNSNFNNGNNITVEAWVRCSNWGNFNHPMIVAKGINVEWILWKSNDAGVVGKLGWRAAGQAYSTTTLLDNVWYQCVGSVGSSGTKVYVNGILEGTNGTTVFTSGNIDVTIAAGLVSGSPSNILGGNVAITRIYNRQLTDNEVLQNYNATKSRYGL